MLKEKREKYFQIVIGFLLHERLLHEIMWQKFIFYFKISGHLIGSVWPEKYPYTHRERYTCMYIYIYIFIVDIFYLIGTGIVDQEWHGWSSSRGFSVACLGKNWWTINFPFLFLFGEDFIEIDFPKNLGGVCFFTWF